jgi:hypothetical protein
MSCYWCRECDGEGHVSRDSAHRAVTQLEAYAASAHPDDGREINDALSVVSSLLIFPREGGCAIGQGGAK